MPELLGLFKRLQTGECVYFFNIQDIPSLWHLILSTIHYNEMMANTIQLGNRVIDCG